MNNQEFGNGKDFDTESKQVNNITGAYNSDAVNSTMVGLVKSDKGNDSLIVIIGIILVISIPFIACFISLSRDSQTTLTCTKNDKNTAKITYEIVGTFTGKKVDKMEYIINYDISNLDQKSIDEVREDERELGESYKNENHVDYIIINANNKMSLHVYGYGKDVEAFYDAKYSNNKSFLEDKIIEEGYTCKEG